MRLQIYNVPHVQPTCGKQPQPATSPSPQLPLSCTTYANCCPLSPFLLIHFTLNDLNNFPCYFLHRMLQFASSSTWSGRRIRTSSTAAWRINCGTLNMPPRRPLLPPARIYTRTLRLWWVSEAVATLNGIRFKAFTCLPQLVRRRAPGPGQWTASARRCPAQHTLHTWRLQSVGWALVSETHTQECWPLRQEQEAQVQRQGVLCDQFQFRRSIGGHTGWVAGTANKFNQRLNWSWF